jgi:ketosteroid isomerase-like protein
MTPRFLRAGAAALSLAAPLLALASPPAASAPKTTSAPAQARPPAVRIAPGAEQPVMVVNSYMDALAKGQLDAARNFMAPGALVIADGKVLGDRDAYFANQARSDAAQLQGAQRELLGRDAKAGPAIGWVITEKLLRTNAGGKPAGQFVTETVMLAKTAEGWKIIHIHRSSRPAA